ncbi:MAG: DHHA1 domain-containing protein, partial [Pseudomonadota bacterium]
LAPRLNAAGRLDDMSLGIACLLERDEGRARQLALRLDELNRERRAIESEMKRQAIAQVERLGDLDARASEPGELPWGICVFDEDWHPGVVGIVAARVREKYHRPVIAFAPDGDAGLKGSGRSVPDLHLRDTLDSVAAGSSGLLTRFGGHAMAAGLSLRKRDLAAFTSAFDAAVRARLGEEHLQGVIHSDGELDGMDLGLETAEAIRAGGPWGQGFPEPVFDGRFQVLSHRVVGEAHLKLLLRSPDGDAVDAIAFNRAGLAEGGLPDHLHLAYRLDVNEFRGQRSPQLIVEHVTQ